MLTPLRCCIQVALSINRATYCFDTSTSRYPARRGWGSVVYFWRTASTNGNLSGNDKAQRAARFCQLAKHRHCTQVQGAYVLGVMRVRQSATLRTSAFPISARSGRP